MSLQSIFVVNTAPGCDNFIEQQISADTCNSYIVRITPNTNAIGPFNVYIDSLSSTPVYSAQTRTQMLNGVVVQLGPCVTPTPTPTPSFTPTPSITPTFTSTPTTTPTNTQTPTNTPTNTGTPSITPSQTQTQTPTTTGTPTQTPTQTQTPTPSPTPAVLIIEVLLQDGNPLLLQNLEPLLEQQSGVLYSITSGQTLVSIDCNPVTLTQSVYALASSWNDITRFYSDAGLSTPFNGGDLYYTNDAGGTSGWYQINSSGYITNTYGC